MTNWIKKYWWVPVVVLFFILLPIALNYLIKFELGFDVIGEPKDWLMFWGTYISSFATAIMVFLTYVMIRQNNESRKARILFRPICDKSKQIFHIEVTNIGIEAAMDLNIEFCGAFLNDLSTTDKSKLDNYSKCNLILKTKDEHEIKIPAYCLRKENNRQIKVIARYKTLGNIEIIEQTLNFAFSITK